MSADEEVCATGLWVDDATGQVVDSAPLTGRQLVPPGGVMRKDRVRAVEAARAAAPVVADQPDPEPVVEAEATADEPEADTADQPDPEPEKAPAKKAAARKG